MKRLSEKEQKIMEVFWRENREMNRQEVMECWEEGKELHLNTIATFLRRLEEKGYLVSEVRKKKSYYRAMITWSEYCDGITAKLPSFSIKDFVLNYCEARKIKKSDLEELKRILDNLEEKN